MTTQIDEQALADALIAADRNGDANRKLSLREIQQAGIYYGSDHELDEITYWNEYGKTELFKTIERVAKNHGLRLEEECDGLPYGKISFFEAPMPDEDFTRYNEIHEVVRNFTSGLRSHQR